MACASMAMRMIVCLHLLLEITNVLLELLHLLFQCLDTLLGVGVLVTSLFLSHKSSLHSACYSARSDNSTIGLVPGMSSGLCKYGEGAGFPSQTKFPEDGTEDAVHTFYVHKAHHGPGPLEFLESRAHLEFQADPLLALLRLAGTLDSAAQLLALAGIDDLLGIDGIPVNLLFQNFSVFADQEVDAARGFVFVDVDAVLASDVSSPITQKREGNADLVGEGFIGEGAVHAHTQDLGVGGFQLLKILLEGLHLRGSTTGEGKDVEGQDDVAFAAILA